jgi:hypothetical protein
MSPYTQCKLTCRVGNIGEEASHARVLFMMGKIGVESAPRAAAGEMCGGAMTECSRDFLTVSRADYHINHLPYSPITSLDYRHPQSDHLLDYKFPNIPQTCLSLAP